MRPHQLRGRGGGVGTRLPLPTQGLAAHGETVRCCGPNPQPARGMRHSLALPAVLAQGGGGETLTASSQQIVHDNHLLPWLQGVSLDFQLSLQVGSRHRVRMWPKPALECRAQDVVLTRPRPRPGSDPPSCCLAM